MKIFQCIRYLIERCILQKINKRWEVQSLNKLLYLSGNDLPFVQGKINIHQPKIKEIAFLGQDIFYLGSNFLSFSKQNLNEQDKSNLENKTNFDVLMSIINNKTDTTVRMNVMSIELVLSLIFPQYQLIKMPNMLIFNKIIDGKKEQGIINNDNFEQFKQIIKEMFCLNTLGTRADYNPANKLAEQIANKLRDRHKKLQKKTEGQKSINILSRYISILILANQHTYSELMQYTVYQLFDQFKRFQKKYSYDTWFQAKLAGAENLEDVDSWLSDEEDQIISRPSSNRIEFS